MAQQRPLPVGKNGSPPSPSFADTRIPDRKDPPMHPVKPPAVKPFLNGPHSHAQCNQLAMLHNAVLSLGQSRNFPSHPGVSEFSHDMSWLSSDTPWVLPPCGRDSALSVRC